VRTHAILDKVHVLEDYRTLGHRLLVFGRGLNFGRCWLDGDGEWHEITEDGAIAPGGGEMGERLPGIYLPAGALDAVVSAYHGTTAPQPATERHLEDAIAVRDRLLTLVEKRR
jgi:hypothetical protein